MKKVFLIILIVFLCVIGALGLAIGGFYLFGGFNEKVVYADELHFNKTEIISAENIFLKIDTDTPEVTRKEITLVSSLGGENIINFPKTVNIGQTFRVIPKQKDGENIGGNVTLTAIYKTNDANVSVQAKCEILIDIPVKSATLNLSSSKLKTDDEIIVCKTGEEFGHKGDLLTIEPFSSLMAYEKSGVVNETIKNSIVDKVMYLELSSLGDQPIEKVAYFVDETGNKYASNTIKIEYEYDEVKKTYKFLNTIRLKAGSESSDAQLNLYVYSTYKEQNKSSEGRPDIILDKNLALNNVTDFVVGSYEIDNMKIFDSNINVENKDVLLNKEIRIYLNNPTATNGNINLNLKLEANQSPSAHIGNMEYKNNVYLHISNSDLLTLTKKDGTTFEQGEHGDRGININCNDIGTQLSSWYWVLKISSFHAYYNYFKTGTPIVATLSYYNDEYTASVPNKTFNIVPTINEVDYLEPNYKDENSFKVKSGEEYNIGPKDILIKSKTTANPTYTDLAFYLDFAENTVNNQTTISTVPTQAGEYKAVFTFKLPNKLEQSQLKNLTVSTGGWANVNIDKNEFELLDESSLTYKGTVYLTLLSSPEKEELFTIIDPNDNKTYITRYLVKFYEQIENSNIDGTASYYEIPYLSIGGIRYYIDYDLLIDENNRRYLKINNDLNVANSYKVSGIGSFIITAQLVYIENGTGNEPDKIYWLGKKTDVKVDVYEELSSLSAYNYISEDEYNTNFGDISLNEDDKTTYYIFITSNEIEALKNYVAYNQINVSYYQFFAGLDTSNYKGINEINKDAITFGDKFEPVRKNNVIVGYRLSYKVNPIHTIKIDDVYLDNIFRIEIAIEVNGQIVNAEFKMDSADFNFLDIKINDKIIKQAVLNYNVAGDNGSSIDKAIELEADIVGGELTYGNGLEDNLRYYFKYDEAETNGIIDSLSYRLRIVDNINKINIANLYSFTRKYDEDILMGKGGLKFFNFPVILDENGNNIGVLVEFTIFSNDSNSDFNTHYEYVNGMFIKTLNDNLTASLYFRIYGIEVSLEEKENVEFVGYEGNSIDMFSSSSNPDANSIFQISLRKSKSGNEITTTDYSQVFTAVAGNSYAMFESIDGKVTYSKLVMNKDCLNNSDVSFSFYIGSTADANMIQIKRVDDRLVTTSYLTIQSAYEVTTNNNFTSPSSNNNVVVVKYKNNANNQDINELVNISVNLPENLPTFAGITKPIIIKSTTGNLFTFITVPREYSITLTLSIIKNYDDGTHDSYQKSFEIFVLPNFIEEDLTIGEDKEGFVNKVINAGAGKDNLANFSGKLLDAKDNIIDVTINYTDVASSDNDDIEDYKKIKAEDHMYDNFDSIKGQFIISSTSLNYNKVIKAKITITFKDGGNFIYEKTITVLGNISLEFKRNIIEIDKENNHIALIDEALYNFTENGVVNAENNGFSVALSEFVYNGDGDYNKDSFRYDETIFKDVTAESHQAYEYYWLRVKYESLEKGTIETTITFEYKVGNYSLFLDLDLIIVIK